MKRNSGTEVREVKPAIIVPCGKKTKKNMNRREQGIGLEA